MPIKEDAASIIRQRLFYAWFSGGGGTLAQYDDTGAWVADMETGLTGTAWGCIKEDSGGDVANGAIMAVQSGSIKVFDWNRTGGMLTHTYSPAVGSRVTPPIWHGGYIHWAQGDTADGSGNRTILWRRAAADLTSVTTVASGVSGDWATGASYFVNFLALAGDNLWCMGWASGAGQYLVSVRIRSTGVNSWSALAGTTEFMPGSEPEVSEAQGIVLPVSTGPSIGLIKAGGLGTIAMHAVEATPDPDDDERVADDSDFPVYSGSDGNADTNRGETVALSYAKGGGQAWVYLGDQSEGIQFEDHPTLSTSPNKVFFAED